MNTTLYFVLTWDITNWYINHKIIKNTSNYICLRETETFLLLSKINLYLDLVLKITHEEYLRQLSSV